MTDVKAELLSPEVIVAAAREIEPELGCWKNGSQDWEWRRGQECKHAERILKAVIEALATRPQPSPKVDGLVERGRIAFIMEAAKIERDVGLHDLTEDEQRDLIAAVIKAALANPSVDFSRDLARLRDSQGLPEGDRVEVDINALCDVLSGGQALLKSVQP